MAAMMATRMMSARIIPVGSPPIVNSNGILVGSVNRPKRSDRRTPRARPATVAMKKVVLVGTGSLGDGILSLLERAGLFDGGSRLDLAERSSDIGVRGCCLKWSGLIV